MFRTICNTFSTTARLYQAGLKSKVPCNLPCGNKIITRNYNTPNPRPLNTRSVSRITPSGIPIIFPLLLGLSGILYYYKNIDEAFANDIYPKSPRYNHLLERSKIIKDLQANAVFTTATDEKPIVASYGACPGVILGGYDPTNKIAFIVRFSKAKEVSKLDELLFYNITELAKNEIKEPIQIHLRGSFDNHSEEIVEAIKLWMTRRGDLPMKIVSEDILGSEIEFKSKSLSIDSRTGEISNYHPISIPYHRDMNELGMESNWRCELIEIGVEPKLSNGREYYGEVFKW